MTKISGLFDKDLCYIKVQKYSFSCPQQEGIAYSGVEAQLHSFVTLAIDEGEWLTSRPSHFTSAKEPWYKLGGPRSRTFGKEKNLSFLPGFETQTVQPVD